MVVNVGNGYIYKEIKAYSACEADGTLFEDEAMIGVAASSEEEARDKMAVFDIIPECVKELSKGDLEEITLVEVHPDSDSFNDEYCEITALASFERQVDNNLCPYGVFMMAYF